MPTSWGIECSLHFTDDELNKTRFLLGLSGFRKHQQGKETVAHIHEHIAEVSISALPSYDPRGRVYLAIVRP